MFEYEIEHIHSILANVLGEAKNEGYSNGWRSYNCPYCADMEGVRSDNKYNLETNVERGCTFHCWKCETRGKLSKIIADYGSADDLAEYKNELKSIRSSRLYQMSSADISDGIIDVENCMELPKGFKPVCKADTQSYPAMAYLYKRGIGDDIIDKFKIGYIGSGHEDFSLRNRVIIPSYDISGDVNYWVGRDYTGTNKVKYRNPKIRKTSIVFNEGIVDWYADITLVEGPFDHIVVPNSIPLLGKTIKHDDAVYCALAERSHANINILLDDDAVDNAYRMYKFLDNGKLRNRIRLIKCPQGYDAALIYEKFRRRGIIRLLQLAEKVNEYDLMKIR